MSRPSRTLLPATLALLSINFTACVGTVYDRMYSNKKTYFKAPVENKSEASAEAILSQVDATTQPGAVAPGADAAGGLPPAGGEIPGLPPAGAPMDPAAPAVPPAAPPPAVPPPAVPPPAS